jgi:hypothetical protein
MSRVQPVITSRQATAQAVGMTFSDGKWKIEDRGWRMENRNLTITDRTIASSFGSMSTKIIGSLNHSIQHSTDALPNFIQLTMLIRVDVTTFTSVIQSGLGFHCLS